ncbi:hypothetical protein [Halorubrum tropicale]|jgi:hypothetical protein|uniref:hypothetical protein n=1 Tax=Halorubrum tropicale TaxID=1765655 RepID=UPI000A66937D|nr:hypothetical protein [Halorubrum tropicale]
MFDHYASGFEIPDRPRNRNTIAGRDHFQFHRPPLDLLFLTPVLQSESMPPKEVVRIEDRQDRWRYVCPRGHRSWEPTNHHFWCKQCASGDEFDGVFHTLRDQKTGAELARDQIRLLTDAGPYDRKLDGEEGSA